MDPRLPVPTTRRDGTRARLARRGSPRWHRPLAVGLGILAATGAAAVFAWSAFEATRPASERDGLLRRGARRGSPAPEEVVRLSLAEQRAAGIRVQPVAERLFPVSIPVTGHVEVPSSRPVRLVAPAESIVHTWLARPGDRVRAGQPIATVVSREVADAQQAVRGAEERLDEARDALRRHANEVARAEAAASRSAAAPAAQPDPRDLGDARRGLAAARDELARAEAAVPEAERAVFRIRGGLLRAETEVAQEKVRVEQSRPLGGRSPLGEPPGGLLGGLGAGEPGQQAARDALHAAEARAERLRTELRAAESAATQARADLRVAQARSTRAETQLQDVERGRPAAVARRADAPLATAGTGTHHPSLQAALRHAETERDDVLRRFRALGAAPGSGSVVTVRAPIGGLLDGFSEAGEATGPVPLAALHNPRVTWARLEVPAGAKIEPGQEDRLRAEGGGAALRGTVAEVLPGPPGAASTPAVRCALREDSEVKPATVLRGEILTRNHTYAVAVPRAALHDEGGLSVVYLQAGPESFIRRPVRTGRADAGVVEVSSGIRPLDWVVVSGAARIARAFAPQRAAAAPPSASRSSHGGS